MPQVCLGKLVPGEGAFYGPKIECSLKDCMGRVQQCGTIQVDFSTPGRLGAQYVAEDSSKQEPVMLHRAVLGSFERFIRHFDRKLRRGYAALVSTQTSCQF